MMSSPIKGARTRPVVALLTAIVLVPPASGFAAGRMASRQYPTPLVLQAPGSGITLPPASSGFSPTLSFSYPSEQEKTTDPKSPSGKDDPAAVPAARLHRNTGRALFEIGSVMMYSRSATG